MWAFDGQRSRELSRERFEEIDVYHNDDALYEDNPTEEYKNEDYNDEVCDLQGEILCEEMCGDPGLGNLADEYLKKWYPSQPFENQEEEPNQDNQQNQ